MLISNMSRADMILHWKRHTIGNDGICANNCIPWLLEGGGGHITEKVKNEILLAFQVSCVTMIFTSAILWCSHLILLFKGYSGTNADHS